MATGRSMLKLEIWPAVTAMTGIYYRFCSWMSMHRPHDPPVTSCIQCAIGPDFAIMTAASITQSVRSKCRPNLNSDVSLSHTDLFPRILLRTRFYHWHFIDRISYSLRDRPSRPSQRRYVNEQTWHKFVSTI